MRETRACVGGYRINIPSMSRTFETASSLHPPGPNPYGPPCAHKEKEEKTTKSLVEDLQWLWLWCVVLW